MIEWKLGVVQHIPDTIGEDKSVIQEVEVLLEDGSLALAIHDTGLFPRLAEGDQVLLNTTAVSLHLGSGGVHFVHAILSGSGGLNLPPAERTGHIMKLRYTSLQRAVLAAEEPLSPHHDKFSSIPQTLEGMPVLAGELHSMLPAVLCFIRARQQVCKPLRIAYVMSDGGALPIAFSKHVKALQELNWLAGTITYGHAYGGDIETVNKYTALLAAKHILQADITVAVMGPGCVGTGTQLGFSGLEVGEILNAASALGGEPIVIPRVGFADKRARHRGISHHTLTVLSLVAHPGVIAALPELEGEQGDWLRRQIEETGLNRKHRLQWSSVSPIAAQEEACRAYKRPITSMGRGLHSDPAFFAGAEAAAAAAWSCLQGHK